MTNDMAIKIVDGNIGTADAREYYDAWQYLIDRGLTRTLRGHYGRTAASLIHAGVCHE